MAKNLRIAVVLLIIATFVLKVSSMVRDMVIAYYFGGSYITDAYLAAFVIPNMIILFMLTGMKDSLVPSYIQASEQSQQKKHLSDVFKGTTLVGLLLSVAGVAISPWLIPLLYPHFSDEAMTIAIWVAILYFSSLLIVCINAVFEGIFDAEKKFFFSTVSQIIVVLFTIGFAIFFTPYIGIYSVPIGFITGSIVSLLVKLINIVPRKLFTLRGKLDWQEVNAFYLVFIPVGLTIAVGQVNVLVDNIFANRFEEGVITYINYANRLVHFPQAIFGVTIATIVLPILSKAIAQKDDHLFKKGIEQGLTTMFFILLPSVIGMLLLMPNLIKLLFERGAFGPIETIATSEVAIFYLGSVLFYSLHGVTTKGFYSKKKGHLILVVGILSILLNILFNWLFTMVLGYKGLALSSSVVALFYVGISFFILVRMSGGLNLKFITKDFLKVIIATSVMAFVIIQVMPLIGHFSNLIYIIIVALLGIILYVGSAYLLKISAFSSLMRGLLKK
ncbi:murein biosynthesis integral membrane protein MurJ [Anaerobacillus isosaccharinicus]|uniref:Lipid II flippase n=1 Tax=Anaerobacillus isosaccharinicus TaxID=1532552 RepID=A0A1S2KZY0_9BACI|nr:murein biosynthesis integral membrane protein MurJ [Anaerobacillus isosaccharinicus]MBA5584508.1 murein biosynthesis integral membrane protein MurJ [Anaerobacillus isosaccharinicus]QOY37108.1 murein biosynthesis integral membrane protein MurJ [Anaerobacillus isosaccharinicus]